MTNDSLLQIGSEQALGRRPLLEDKWYATQNLITAGGLACALAVVADGIGGEGHGERAAKLTIDTIVEVYTRSLVDKAEDLPALLQTALEEANTIVLQAMQQYRHQQDMGCTCVVAAIHTADDGRRLYLANVGDSRAYLVRGKQLSQLTIDHTWGNDLVRAGKRKLEEVKSNPNRDKITRSIGYDPALKVDLGLYLSSDLAEAEAKNNQGLLLHPGDRLVLCSDGLIKPRRGAPGHYVENSELVTIVNAGTPAAAARQLIDLADRQRQADDNVTVIVLAVPGHRPSAVLGLPWQSFVPAKTLMAATAALIALAVFGLLSLAAIRLLFPAEIRPPTPTIPPIEPNLAYVSDLSGRAESVLPAQISANALKIGDKIGAGQGSLVRVVDSGRLRLGLANGSVAFLDSNTEIELRQIGGTGGAQDTIVQLNYGHLLVSINLPPGQGFYVLSETGSRAQAVDTATLMCLQYDQSQQFDLDCLGGSCRLTGRNGGLQDLVSGQHSFLFGGGKPSIPDPARYEQCQNLGDPGLVATPTLTPTNPPPTLTATPVTATPTREVVQPTSVPPTFTPAPSPVPYTGSGFTGPLQPDSQRKGDSPSGESASGSIISISLGLLALGLRQIFVGPVELWRLLSRKNSGQSGPGRAILAPMAVLFTVTKKKIG